MKRICYFCNAIESKGPIPYFRRHMSVYNVYYKTFKI